MLMVAFISLLYGRHQFKRCRNGRGTDYVCAYQGISDVRDSKSCVWPAI